MAQINNFVRNDGFIDKGVDCSSGIVERWIHVEAHKSTGKSDEEFIIFHKPKCIERFDINKRIHEEAKGTDLKSLIQQVLRTGDETLLNQKQANFVDITGYPTNTMDAMNNLVRGQDILGNLPEDLKSMKLEDLINLSSEDIGNMVKDKINSALDASKDVGKVNNDGTDTTIEKEGGNDE